MSFAAGALFVILLALLHAIRPDLDPSWRFISEYELGPYGWVMRAAFTVLAVSCLALAAVLWPDARGIPGRLGLGLIVLTAAGMLLAAVCVPDPTNKLHEVGAMMDHLPFAAPLVAWSLWRAPRWADRRRSLAWTCWIPLAGLAVFVGSMATMLPQHGGRPGPDVLVGWPNRLMILAQCAWVMLLAWWAADVGPGVEPGLQPRRPAGV